MRKSGQVSESDIELERDMFDLTSEYLGSNGFEHYEISNYAKPEYECRHNLKYWQREEYIAFGPSASSFLGNKRWTNVRNLNRYIESAKSGKSPTDPRLLAERALPQDGEERNERGPKRRRARSVTVNLSESPLGWLHARGHLSDRQFDAGEKLRADWERANLAPRITMRWDVAPVTGGKRRTPALLNETEAQLAAKQRFTNAIDYLGSDLSDIAWRIICGAPSRSRKTRLCWPPSPTRSTAPFAKGTGCTWRATAEAPRTRSTWPPSWSDDSARSAGRCRRSP